MRISSSSYALSFQRRLKASEEADYADVLARAKNKAGNRGHSMLIIPSTSLPQKTNTGVGNILDKDGLKFFDFAKKYWGINSIQLLPGGAFRELNRGEYKPYSGSSLDFGNQIINLELLTRDDYGKILSEADLKQVVESNSSNSVNFENVMNPDSKTEEVLKKAYRNLTKSNSPLLHEMREYSKANEARLNPKAVYHIFVKEHGTFDTRCLPRFEDVNVDEILKSHSEEAEFYKFKQFIAEKHLAQAKKELNKRGIKLSGDFLLGFSYDEVWANPKAFVKDVSLGWGVPALNLETEDGRKLLREKAEFFGKHYDCMRVDAAWAYISQPYVQNGNIIDKKQYGSKILDMIEEGFKTGKGEKFHTTDIMYEFVNNPQKHPELKFVDTSPAGINRMKIYTSQHMSKDWATTSAFQNRGWSENSYILGVTNHDSNPMRTEFFDKARRVEEIKILSKILKIPENKLSSYSGFMQAKFAEPMCAKHNMLFFTEALNLDGRYKDNKNPVDDYRLKIPAAYEDNYFKSLERGEGYNPMDALDKAFVSKGLDKTEPELYKKIVKYKKILQQKEGRGKYKLAYISAAAFAALACGLMIMRGRSFASAPEKKS